MRLTIEDFDFVMQFTTPEAGWDDVSDDFTRDADKEAAVLAVLTDPQTICLAPDQNSFWVFQQRTMILYEAHVQVLPTGRGKAAFRAGVQAITWMFENTLCQKIFGFTPADNKKAVLFTRKVGFRAEGVCTRSRMYRGMLHDQIISGLSKAEWTHKEKKRCHGLRQQ